MPYKGEFLKTASHALRSAVEDFIAKDASSRGAAIAFYVVTSFVPVLVIVIAVAGLAFGEEAARVVIVKEISKLVGQDGAELLRTALRSAAKLSDHTMAAVAGVVTLILASSGVFVELRDALNAIWDVKPRGETLSRFLKARAASLGLVLALGFLLLISLVADAVIKAMTVVMPVEAFVLDWIGWLASFCFTTLVFAAIYRFLPSRDLEWRDVGLGALGTAVLFEIGKYFIGLYLGSSQAGSSFGAAGALIGLLFWIYYSAQIFLFGAALAKVYVTSRRAMPRPTHQARSRATRQRPITRGD